MLIVIILAFLVFVFSTLIYIKKDNGAVKSLVTGSFWGLYAIGFSLIFLNF